MTACWVASGNPIKKKKATICHFAVKGLTRQAQINNFNKANPPPNSLNEEEVNQTATEKQPFS